MKILRIIPTLDPTGGGPMEGIRQLTPCLSTYGIQTTVLTLDDPDSPFLSDDFFNTIALGPVTNGYGYIRGLVKEISHYAETHDCAIVHGLWQYHAFAAWRALHRTAIPYFVYPHGMLDPWFKRTYPLKHLKKWAYWPWADYRVLRDAAAVLFTSEREMLLARESFCLYRANEVVVGYGTASPPLNVDGQRQIFFARFPHLRGKRIFLFLSRLHPKKGIDLLLHAFADVASSDPLLHLVIAGPDQVGLRAKLEQQATSLCIAGRITWAGMLSGELKWGAYRAAELFCLPSHQENFGIVVAEALACGVPVAIAEPVNISTQVSKVGAGLVHPDTVQGTTDALRRWNAMQVHQKVHMGQLAKQLFANQFDSTSVAKKLVPVLTSLPSDSRFKLTP
jgi:glycosyltransferase involved in cell wall biosynthesis